MLSTGKPVWEINCSIRINGSIASGLVIWALLYQHNHLLQIRKRPCKAGATTRHSSNSSDFKDLALWFIPFLPINQYTFLVSTIYNFINLQFTIFIFSVNSKSSTEFDSTILDFQRESKFPLLTSNTYPAQLTWKFLNHMRHSHISHSYQQG